MYKKILVLAGALVLLTGCGAKKTDVPGTAETEAVTEATTVAQETAAETTTTKAEETQPVDTASAETPAEETTKAPAASDSYDLGGNGFVSFSIPEITVTKPDISLPDMSVPDIYEFMGMDPVETASSVVESELNEIIPTTETEAKQTESEPVETEVSDSGFVYKGKVMEVGDDEHGYIMVPADCHRFYDDTATNLIQYADDSPYNVITIKHIPGIDSYTYTQGLMKSLDDKGIVDGLTGATVKLGDYDAYQVYCRYPDGIFVVWWAVEDKNAPENGSYYICFELDADHMDDFALASTYKMPKDHK